MTVKPLRVSEGHIRETLEMLRSSGDEIKEGIVLWLGHREDGSSQVLETYVPDHKAERDYFRIPPDSIARLLAHLRTTGQFVAAQVHSHPREAFHSLTDDTWAIVRHVGALSLVVPWFARNTEPSSFLRDVAAFELTDENRWEQIAQPALPHRIVIV